jgi:hypothetical protein
MKHHWFRGILLGICLGLLVVSGTALAQPAEQEKDVPAPAEINAPPMSDFLDIRVDNLENLRPRVAYNARRDEFLVVWEEHIHGGEIAIYGRRVGGGGSMDTPVFPVWHEPNQQHTLPDVAYCPKSDTYLVAWTYKHSSTDTDIHARLVRGTGQLGPHIFVDFDLYRHWYPAVACSTQADEFLVVYENYLSDTRRDIEGQRVQASNGSLLSWRNLAGANDQLRRLPDVAYNPARNEYLIAYVLNRPALTPGNPPRQGDIVARISSFNMGSLSSELSITPFGMDPSQEVVVLAAGHDEYMAVFGEDHGPSTSSIWGRRVSGTGSLSSFVNIGHDTGVRRMEPAVAFGDGGRYLVPWRHAPGLYPNWDIQGRTVQAGQNTPEGPQFDIDARGAAQRVPAVACAPSGPCLVVYEDDWLGGGDYEIRGRLVGARRAFLPAIRR